MTRNDNPISIERRPILYVTGALGKIPRLKQCLLQIPGNGMAQIPGPLAVSPAVVFIQRGIKMV